MTRISGRLTKIGLGRETVRGTSVVPTYWIPVLEMGFDDQLEMKDNESGFGVIAAISDSQVVRKWGEGDYSGKIFHKSVGLELFGVFGQLPTSVQRTTTGVYDHTYAMLQTNQHGTLTVAVSDANYSGRFAMAGINSWSLEAEVGDYIRRSVSLISKASASSSESPAYTNEIEFIPKHMSVRFAAAGANDTTLDAAAAIKVRAVNFEVSKNATALQIMGTNDIDDVANTQLEVAGEIELYYDDRTYHNLALAGTHQSARIEMMNSDIIIGTSGTHNPALRFQFAEIVLSFPERGFDLNDISTITVPFKAVLNIASGGFMTARLTNDVAAY